VTDRPDIDPPSEDRLRGRLSRVIAILIGITTLATAYMAFLQHEAAAANTDASLRAQRLGIQAAENRFVSEQRAQVDLHAYAVAVEQRQQAANLGQQARALGGAEAHGLLVEAETWTRMAERTDEITPVRVGAPDGPDRDPAFPSRFIAASGREAIRLGALQDAVNDESSGWSERSSAYTAILAIFAVALYLFGFSLTVERVRVRAIYATAGIALFIVGSGWGALGAVDPPRLAPDEAADAYADGRLALDTAWDATGYQEAYDRLSRAIELRPGFARAYVERSEAAFRLGSPQRSGFFSISSPEWLERSTADLVRAHELGSREIKVLADLGFQRFLQGIQAHRPELLEQSIAATRQAMALTPGDPVVRYNLAVALLAAGRTGEARAAYADAVRATVYGDVGARVAREDPYGEEAYLAGALTDLGLLESFRPELVAEIAEIKASIVTAVASGASDRPPPASAPEVSDLAVDVFPSTIQWRAHLDGFEPGTDTLSVQWLLLDPAGLGWAVLPEISALSVDPVPNSDEPGGYFHLDAYTAAMAPPACLPSGTYRVELYSGGRLVGQAEKRVAFGDFDALAVRDVGVVLCRPRGWEAAPERELGLIAGARSPDGTEGVYVVHLQQPRLEEDPGETSVRAIEETLATYAGVLPGRAAYVQPSGTDDGYFLGLDGGRWRWYPYDGGLVRIGAGLGTDGSVTLALVFGPDVWFDGEDWGRILDSVGPFE
jgi:tetratricopeptide (TPR) repeat protein